MCVCVFICERLLFICCLRGFQKKIHIYLTIILKKKEREEEKLKYYKKKKGLIDCATYTHMQKSKIFVRVCVIVALLLLNINFSTIMMMN